jgi:hypothetical protein
MREATGRVQRERESAAAVVVGNGDGGETVAAAKGVVDATAWQQPGDEVVPVAGEEESPNDHSREIGPASNNPVSRRGASDQTPDGLPGPLATTPSPAADFSLTKRLAVRLLVPRRAIWA